MSKTPLELTADILQDDNRLFELNHIYEGLLAAISIQNNERAKNEIIKALAHRISTMAIYASNVYWSAVELQKALVDALKENSDTTEEDLPFVTPTKEE